MSQEDQTQAANPKLRTRIEDLPTDVQELSEEEASEGAGGLVIVTTPNQLSLLNLVTLAIRRRHSAFQDVHYPAHRTALLESDLVRCAHAAQLDVVEIRHSGWGRLPLVPWHYPGWLAATWPRRLSDNVMLVARKPHV